MVKKEIDRRNFLSRSATAAAFATSAMSGARNAHAMSNEEIPNILMIISDDIGSADMGCYGHPMARTENLDRMAGEGIRFTNAFCTASSCSPSRASIFTGRYPHATRAEDLHVPLPPSETIFPSILADHGYHTMYVGKLHLGNHAKKQFHQSDVQGDSHVPSHEFLDTNSNRWKSMLKGRPKNKPFFMGIGFADPHRPYKPGAIPNPTDPSDVIVPPYLADTDETREELALYYDYSVRMDRNVGEVLDTLKTEGLADNTIVLFMSDNGIPFPRAKVSCYDSGIKIPLLIKWPGKIKGGIVSESLVSLVDIAPTLLSLVGIKVPSNMQGVDIKELLFNPESDVRKYIYAERNWHNLDDHQRAVRNKRYKYIKHHFPREPMPLASDLYASTSYSSLLRLRDAKLP